MHIKQKEHDMIQEECERIAAEKYDEEFYELSEDLRDEIFDIAETEIKDQLEKEAGQ